MKSLVDLVLLKRAEERANSEMKVDPAIREARKLIGQQRSPFHRKLKEEKTERPTAPLKDVAE